MYIKASQHLGNNHSVFLPHRLDCRQKEKKMKVQLLAAIAICFFAIALGYRKYPDIPDWTQEQFPLISTGTGPYAGPSIPQRPKPWLRVRRYADPQGSITLEAQKPLSGPDRRPSVNLDYNHNLLNNGPSNVNAYGGANWQQGGRVTPHGGVNFQHNFGRNGNGFVGGFGQIQPGSNGRLSPSFGVGGGYRFRRDLELKDETFDNVE